MTDTDDVIIYLSRSIAHLFELGKVLSVEMYTRFLHPEDRARVAEIFSKAKAVREECQADYRVHAPDGSLRWVTGSGAPRFADDGQFLGYAGALIDVTDHYAALERLAKSEASHRMLTDNSLDLISHHAPQTGIYRYASPSFQRVLGYAPGELVDCVSIYTQVHPDDIAVIRDEIKRQSNSAADSRQIEFRVRHKDGHMVWMGTSVKLLLNPLTNENIGSVAVSRDVTARREAEHRLQRLATHDTLTGLPNRTLLNERVQQMLDGGPRDMPVAVMFIDLDRFKEVNDSYGHEAGDVLLREVARRLRRALRPSDIIARLGGDEFVVAAYCSAGAESAASIAEKLLATLEAPIDIGPQEVVIGASIGLSMFPEHARTKELLFQSADTAMYRAKAAGRNGYLFFAAEMTVEARTRMTLELSLRHALARQEFVLHYQPRIDLRSMSIVGMEALIRWNHPELGQVSPLQFIPIAEETGLIEAIGEWVLEEACLQTTRLMEKFGRPLCISVNMSARQLKSRAIVGQVQAALHKAGLPPAMLELELTESTLIENIENSARVLKELKGLGLRLAVDDFGTGYSGLAYLRRFPLDVLKLDRSFVLQQDDDDQNFEFIKAFVDMAHALKMSVVAEGVESSETLQFLRNAACDEAQGYFLAKPLSLEDFESYLARLPRQD
ncbi:MAG: EAL domain-containing protein [Noviherbaspirillum sp.]